MIRAFIFDYDDTLVQTRQCKFAAIKETGVRYYSHQLSDSDIENHWGKPFQTLFHELFRSHDSDLSRVIERYLSVTAEYPMTAYPGATEALVALSSQYSIGVLTSASREVVLSDLARLGFPLSKMAMVQCAEDTQHHKPDPRVFDPLLLTLKDMGIAASETVYVGDSPSDLSAASAAGLKFVGFSSSSEHSFLATPVEVISDLRQLLS